MRSKVVTREEALTKINDAQTIMFGDWHGELSAEELISGMLEKGVKEISAIAVSAGMPDQGVGRLIKEHRVKSIITTHIGLNPVARDQMFAGELKVEFVPQGTFAERIRCGGAGLGGCLTPTGIGTDVEIIPKLPVHPGGTQSFGYPTGKQGCVVVQHFRFSGSGR